MGLVIEGGKNMIQDLTPGGPAQLAGIAKGDLIYQLDGEPLLQFDGHDGIVPGTVVIISEPISIMGAHAALDASRSTHSFVLIRAIDAESPEYQRQLAEMQHNVPEYVPTAATNASVGSATPSEHPWAGAIAIPDATFGQSSMSIKAKYNLPNGVGALAAVTNRI